MAVYRPRVTKDFLVSTEQTCSVGAFSQAHKLCVHMKERLSLLFLPHGHSVK